MNSPSDKNAGRERSEEGSLLELFVALTDGSLSDAAVANLDRRLRSDPAARSLYIEYISTATLLSQYSRSGTERKNAAPLQETSSDDSGALDAVQFNGRLSHGPGDTVFGLRAAESFDSSIYDADALIDASDYESLPTAPWSPNPAKPKWWATYRLRLIGAAAVLIAATTVALIALHEPASNQTQSPIAKKTEVPGTGETAMAYVALLNATDEAKWSGGNPSVAENRRLGAVPLKLDSGLAEIMFDSGVVAIVQGPAEFTPEGDGRLILRSGRVSARVPAAAKHFTVRTPSATVVDLGTEFGVEANDAGTTVEVFEGRVSLQPGEPGDLASRRTEITAGNARHVDLPDREPAEVKPESMSFIRPREFRARMESRSGSPQARWLAYSYELRRDRDLVAYYTFDNALEAPQQLINRAASTHGMLDGQLGTPSDNIEPPAWTTGRWAGSGALQFSRDARCSVIVPRDPALDLDGPFTLAAWVQNEAPNDAGTVLSRWPSPDGASYQMVLVGNGGKAPNSLQFWTGSRVSDTQYSPVPIGRSTGWQHVAVTFDPTSKCKTFYLNGKRIGEQRRVEPVARGAADLYIGTTPPRVGLPENFHGRIAELCILKRQMSEQDLAAMFEAGKPD